MKNAGTGTFGRWMILTLILRPSICSPLKLCIRNNILLNILGLINWVIQNQATKRMMSIRKEQSFTRKTNRSLSSLIFIIPYKFEDLSARICLANRKREKENPFGFLPHDTILGHTATQNRENKLKMLWQTINYQNTLSKSFLWSHCSSLQS